MAYQSLSYDSYEKSYSNAPSQVGVPEYFEQPHTQPAISPANYKANTPYPGTYPSPAIHESPRMRANYSPEEGMLRLAVPINTILYVLLAVCGLLLLLGIIAMGRGSPRTVYIRKR